MGTHETGEGVKRNIFPFLRASQLVSVQSNRKANIVYPRNACVRVASGETRVRGSLRGGEGGWDRRRRIEERSRTPTS